MASKQQRVKIETDKKVQEMLGLLNAQRAKEGLSQLQAPDLYEMMAVHYQSFMKEDGYGIE